MSDWAAKVLEGVGRIWTYSYEVNEARMGAGDGLAASNALIDLIGELGREVHYLIDGCETSGDKGDEVHTIEGQNLERVSALLDQIEALPFEEPGVILGPGAMLQAALKQTFLAHITALTEQNQTWQRNSRETFDAMVAMRNSINEHLPMPSLESDLLQGPENSVFCAAVADAVVQHVAALTAQVAELEACLERQVSGHREDLDEIANVSVQRLRRAEAAEAERDALRAKVARIASAWPIVRDADCSGGTLASAMDEIEAALTNGGKDG